MNLRWRKAGAVPSCIRVNVALSVLLLMPPS
jgi:hypothetical protein